MRAISDIQGVRDEQFRVIIHDVLKPYLAQFSEYNHGLCGRLSALLSELIKVRIEEACQGRYKIVSQVFIGAVRGEGMNVTTQCTWSTTCDKFAMASFCNQALFAVGIVFAVLC